MKGGFLFLILVVLCGCESLERYDLPVRSDGQKYKVDEIVFKRESLGRITGSFSEFPLSDLWRILPDDISFAYDADLSSSVINAEVKDVSVDDFLVLITRQLGVDYVNDGRIYYIGKIDIKSFSVYVGRVAGFTKDNINKVIESVKTNEGKSAMLDGGTFVFTDRWSAIQRLHNVLRLSSGRIRNFTVNMWLLNESKVKELYLKGNMKGSYSLEWVAGSTVSYSHWATMLGLVSSFSGDWSESMDVRKFSSLVRDGEKFVYKNGQSVPVMKKTVSDSGTVTTSGVDYVDVGTKIEMEITRLDENSCLLDLSSEVGSGEREIEGYPVKVSSNYNSKFTVEYGDVVLVGQYEYMVRKSGIFGRSDNKLNYWIAVQINVN